MAEKELKEVVGGVDPVLIPHKCAECYRDAEVTGFVLKRNTGSKLTVRCPKPLCKDCAMKQVSLYSKNEWTLDTWID